MAAIYDHVTDTHLYLFFETGKGWKCRSLGFDEYINETISDISKTHNKSISTKWI